MQKAIVIPFFTIFFSVILVILFFLLQILSPYLPNFNWWLISFNDFLAGKYWGLITYAFQHYTWLHLSFNVSEIMIFGYIIEKQLNLLEQFVLFIISALLGGLLLLIMVGLLNPNWLFMGASGVSNAFLGCAFYFYIKLKNNHKNRRILKEKFFYLYITLAIFYIVLPIFNIFNLPQDLAYILNIYWIIFVHFMCFILGLIFGYFYIKKHSNFEYK
ncbi:MAG: rhomboid family intramembrane serine protease [Candidatus Helarchaeota archaeon]